MAGDYVTGPLVPEFDAVKNAEGSQREFTHNLQLCEIARTLPVYVLFHYVGAEG